MFPVHTGIFPFHGKGTGILDPVQCTYDLFKIRVAPAWTRKIPVAPAVTEGKVASENPCTAGLDRPFCILDVYMENAVAEAVQEFHVIHSLVPQVAGIVVEAEGGMVVHGLQGAFRRDDVKGDLGGMHLQSEPDPQAPEFIQDRDPSPGEIPESTVDRFPGNRREGIKQVSDGAS